MLGLWVWLGFGARGQGGVGVGAGGAPPTGVLAITTRGGAGRVMVPTRPRPLITTSPILLRIQAQARLTLPRLPTTRRLRIPRLIRSAHQAINRSRILRTPTRSPATSQPQLPRFFSI